MNTTNQVRRCAARAAQLFSYDGRLSPTLLCLFLVFNGIVLLNSLLHSPIVGYDAEEHASYIQTLMQGRLPSIEDSDEFFAAPLPYAAPILLSLFGVSHFGIILKFAQLLNVFYSVVLTCYVIKICRLARPADLSLAIWSLLLLGMLPVYYKTMAFVRGEPLAACLVVIAMHQTLVIFTSDNHRSARVTGLGFVLGLLILAKQWGWLVLGAIGFSMIAVALGRTEHRAKNLRAAFLVVFVTLAVGGWFYLYLHHRFGSSMAFNTSAAPGFSVANRPREFYLSLGLSQLFTDPVRESFSQSTQLFFPIFYSEVWGDYWCYWVVYGRDVQSRQPVSGSAIVERMSQGTLVTNRNTIGQYLGHVNLAAVIPTAVFAGGGLVGMLCLIRLARQPRSNDRACTVSALLTGTVAVSLVGYLALLVRYPLLDVKASYMLHVFPLAAIVAGDFLSRLQERAPRAHLGVQILLAVSAVHNAPVFLTRYVWS